MLVILLTNHLISRIIFSQMAASDGNILS
uniref:Uncharacterized protein n=1 Tax=Rhizophora mucronata TaxID=61149 RepID=A0A2P2NKV6_RHIMU